MENLDFGTYVLIAIVSYVIHMAIIDWMIGRRIKSDRRDAELQKQTLLLSEIAEKLGVSNEDIVGALNQRQ